LNACFGSKQGQENQHINGGAGMFVPVAFDAFNQADTGDLSKTVAARNDQDTASLVSGCWWDGGDTAPTLTKQNASGAQRMPDKANFGAVLQPIPYDLYQITAPVNRQNRKPGDPCHTLARDNAAHAAVAYNITFCDANGVRSDRPNGGLYVNETDVSSTLTNAGVGTNVVQPVAIQGTLIGRGENAGPQGSGADVSGAMFTLTKTDVHAVAIGTDCFNGQVTGDVAATMGTRGSSQNASGPTVMQPVAQFIGGVDYENNAHGMDEATGPLLKGSPTGGGRPLPAIATAMQVRRLTPVECERLQGFPDGYTNIPWRGKPESPDGPRYKALGNSMAVPVMRWIGERINKVEAL
jgi:DNA (cytosine-5)-methyltransferase 1